MKRTYLAGVAAWSCIACTIANAPDERPRCEEAELQCPAGPALDADASVAIDDPSAEGRYHVASYTSGYRDGPDYGESTIFHPTDATPPFPGVAIVPGWNYPQASIRGWGAFLASHGMVVITIGTSSPTDEFEERRDALLDALETLRSETTRSGGPLEGKLDPQRFAIMGASMGGGAALLAASAHPELKAVISMCGFSLDPAYPDNRVPALLFGSKGDAVAGGLAQSFYDSMPEETPKLLFEWGRGDHALANDPSGAQYQVGRYGLSWLKVFVAGDMRYRKFLDAMPDGATEFRVDL